LVAHQAAERAGHHASHRCGAASEAHSIRISQNAYESCKDEQNTQNDRQSRIVHPNVHHRSYERSAGVHQTKAEQNTPVDVPAQAQESQYRCNQVRNSHCAHRRLHAILRGDERCQQAANSKAGN
jgi:hypothetical protein